MILTFQKIGDRLLSPVEHWGSLSSESNFLVTLSTVPLNLSLTQKTLQ